MERLTVKRADGRWALDRKEGCSNMEQFEQFPIAINKLAAYEDTGFEPEQVRKFSNLLGMALGSNGIPTWDELSEIIEARRDGRLVVLPCGVNDTAWYADTDTNRVLMGYISSYQFLSDGAVYFDFTNVESDIEWVSVELPVDDFSKTVFFTREEAERALEGSGADANIRLASRESPQAACTDAESFRR